MLNMNPAQYTVKQFQAITGIALTPEQVAILLRIHSTSRFIVKNLSGATPVAESVAAPEAETSIGITSDGSINLQSANPIKIESPAVPQEKKLVTPIQSGDGQRSFMSNDFTAVMGYPWIVTVRCKQKNAANSYAVHYSSKPSVEEFLKDYQKFLDGTHWVHVNAILDFEEINHSQEYWSAARDLLARTAAVKAHSSVDTKTAEDNKGKYQLTYFTGNGVVAHKFFDSKPTAWALSMYSNSYGKATYTQL